MLITIDGPAASGKSTVARAVAEALGLDYLDSGALYRTATLAALRAGLPPAEGPALDAFLAGLAVRYRYRKGVVRLFLGGEDVSEEIRGAAVTAAVSAFSALPALRAHLVQVQRRFAEGRDCIAEGRDMGSVVFPQAELKLFLDAPAPLRAQRRAGDFRGQGRAVDAAQVEAELARRDRLDSERSHSPLVRPPDAVVLDNSRLGVAELVAEIARLAEARWPAPLISPEELLYTADTRALPAPRMRPHYFVVWHALRAVFGLLFGFRIRHAERARLRGPLLVAANHIAGLDPLVAGSAVPRPVNFVAKRELFRPALFGALIRAFGAVPIRRGTFDRACFDSLRQRLEAGGVVLFFPEGTRKPVGHLGRAKFGLGLLAEESGAPVLPLFIKGTARPRAALRRHSRIEVWIGRPLHIAPLAARGLGGRALLDAFGEGVMAEIAGLQREAGGP
ncbi:(d)CMP kinase [bacterium]|nr:(d)CMP kinase [bacterium]